MADIINDSLTIEFCDRKRPRICAAFWTVFLQRMALVSQSERRVAAATTATTATTTEERSADYRVAGSYHLHLTLLLVHGLVGAARDVRLVDDALFAAGAATRRRRHVNLSVLLAAVTRL